MSTRTIAITDRSAIEPGDIVTIRVTDTGPGTDNGDMDYEFVSAVREVPEWAPGTTGTATLNNLVSGNSAVGLRAVRTGSQESRPGFALENGMHITDDSSTYSVSDFVPDEPRTLPTEAELTEAMYGVVTNLRATAADYAAAVHAHLVRNASLRGESR